MKRKQYSASFKAKVALEAIRGLKTTNEIASEFGVHTTQIGYWKKLDIPAEVRRGLVDPTCGEILIKPSRSGPDGRQCELLGLSRSSWYYLPKGESELNITLMRMIDEQYIKTPFYGSPKMTALRRQGYQVNHKRVKRLMNRMGLQAAQPKVNTSRKHPEHKIYPYLLSGVKIACPDHVRSADITYIRLAPGSCI